MKKKHRNSTTGMNIAIIGGGFTGLTAAYELTKKGHKVTLFEKEKYLGGLAHGFRQSNWKWHLESAYHHLFTNDHAILSLIKELRLTDKLIITRPITATYWRGGIYPLDSPSSLLSFPGLKVIDRLRTGILLAFLKINPFWQPLESITAKQLFLIFGGRRAWETIWEPLMIGKFGTYADSVVASWLWARIRKRTQNLCYIKGGFHTLVMALENSIKHHGGTIRTGVTIHKIQKQNWKLEIGNWKFDKVLLSTPTPIAAKLVPNWKLEIGNWKFLSIPHLHAQTLILETKEPILAPQPEKASPFQANSDTGVYWLNITDRSFPFLCVVAHTNMIDKKYYGGHHLTYIGNYLPENHPFLALSAKELLKIFQPFIQRLNPRFNFQFPISNFQLFNGWYAQPVHERFYSRRAPKVKTSLPGLYLANMDSIYPWDRGTNYAVELGKNAAKMIHENG